MKEQTYEELFVQYTRIVIEVLWFISVPSVIGLGIWRLVSGVSTTAVFAMVVAVAETLCACGFHVVERIGKDTDAPLYAFLMFTFGRLISVAATAAALGVVFMDNMAAILSFAMLSASYYGWTLALYKTTMPGSRMTAIWPRYLMAGAGGVAMFTLLHACFDNNTTSLGYFTTIIFDLDIAVIAFSTIGVGRYIQATSSLAWGEMSHTVFYIFIVYVLASATDRTFIHPLDGKSVAHEVDVASSIW